MPSTESLCKLIGAEPSLRGAAILHDVGLLAVLEAVALQEILTRHAAGYLGDAIFADFVSTYTEDERKRSGRNERMSCCHHCAGISASLIGTSHFLVPMQICRRNQQSAVSLSFFCFFFQGVPTFKDFLIGHRPVWHKARRLTTVRVTRSGPHMKQVWSTPDLFTRLSSLLHQIQLHFERKKENKNK